MPTSLVGGFREATERERRVAELSRVLDETAASHRELQEIHEATLDELNALKRWVYGRRRERILEGDGQQHLFELQSPTTAEPEGSAFEEPRNQVAAHTRRRRRELDLDKLPHYRHELDVPPAEKICTCCGRAKDRIGEDKTKILDYLPPKLEVHVHVRPKYACRGCKNGVVSPPPPERPIARGIAGPGLIAQIVVGKFSDHLPLYRQEDFFVRHGLHIARSTQCDWVKAAAELLRPLYNRQKELVLKSSVLVAMPIAVGRPEGVPTVPRSIALTIERGWPGSGRGAAARRLAIRATIIHQCNAKLTRFLRNNTMKGD